jgi:hypothetical protein
MAVALASRNLYIDVASAFLDLGDCLIPSEDFVVGESRSRPTLGGVV